MWFAMAEFWPSPRSVFDRLSDGSRLVLEEGDTTADEDSSQPATAIDIFMQQILRSQGIADEGEGTCCRGDQADIRVAEREEQGEEAEGHPYHSGQEAAFTDDGPNRATQTSRRLDLVQVADSAHC